MTDEPRITGYETEYDIQNFAENKIDNLQGDLDHLARDVSEASAHIWEVYWAIKDVGGDAQLAPVRSATSLINKAMELVFDAMVLTEDII